MHGQLDATGEGAMSVVESARKRGHAAEEAQQQKTAGEERGGAPTGVEDPRWRRSLARRSLAAQRSERRDRECMVRSASLADRPNAKRVFRVAERCWPVAPKTTVMMLAPVSVMLPSACCPGQHMPALAPQLL